MAPKPKSPAPSKFAKNNLQAVLDNSLSSYDPKIQMMVKILKNSFLNMPLTNTTNDIPIEYIVKAAESAQYNSDTGNIAFKMYDDSLQHISRDMFVESIGIPDVVPPTVDPHTGALIKAPYDNKLTDDELRSFMLEIGYSDNPPNLANLKK